MLTNSLPFYMFHREILALETMFNQIGANIIYATISSVYPVMYHLGNNQSDFRISGPRRRI